MSPYIYFTKEERERARTADIVELLKSQGETLKRSGSEYEWLDGTQKVTIRGNLWFHQYTKPYQCRRLLDLNLYLVVVL